MEIRDLNQTIAQLEENLKNLDSARIQVEEVTGSNKELSEALAEVSNNVSSLADKITESTSLAIKDMNSTILEFKQNVEKLKTLSESFTKRIEDKSTNIVNEIKNVQTVITTEIISIKQNLESLIEDQKKEIRKIQKNQKILMAILVVTLMMVIFLKFI